MQAEKHTEIQQLRFNLKRVLDSSKVYVQPTKNQQLSVSKNMSAGTQSSAFANSSNMANKIDFGLAPRKVAQAFQNCYAKHGSISKCLQQLLANASLLKFKYRFTEERSSSNMFMMFGFIPKNENLDQLQTQIKRLDDYVYRNHYRSRACALEELLFSPTYHQNSTNQETSTSSVNTSKPNNNASQSFEIVKKTLKTKSTPHSVRDHIPCPYCKNTFSDLSTVSQHLNTCVLTHMKLFGTVFGTRKDYASLLLRSFQSELCGKRKCYICDLQDHAINFDEEENMAQHCWRHGKAFNYTCTNCEYLFNNCDDTYCHMMEKSCFPLQKYIDKRRSKFSASKEHLFLMEAGTDFTGVFPQHYKPFVFKKDDSKKYWAKCLFCSYENESAIAAVVHAREHFQDFPYRCIECDHAAPSKNQIKAHMKSTMHRDYVLIQRNDPLTREEMKVLETMKEKPDSLNAEVKSEIENMSVPENMKEKSDSLNAEIKTKIENIPESITPVLSVFLCQHCGKFISEKSNFDEHQKICQTAKKSEQSLLRADCASNIEETPPAPSSNSLILSGCQNNTKMNLSGLNLKRPLRVAYFPSQTSLSQNRSKAGASSSNVFSVPIAKDVKYCRIAVPSSIPSNQKAISISSDNAKHVQAKVCKMEMAENEGFF